MKNLSWLGLMLVAACGQADSSASSGDEVAILGGSAAAADAYAQTVLLLSNDSPSCTGTLISPTQVLTAGHCVLRLTEISFNRRASPRAKSAITVVVRPADPEQLGLERKLPIADYHVHPQFHPGTLEFDAAIVELAEPVAMAAFPVLATAEQTAQLQTGFTIGRAIGYGKSRVEGRVFKPLHYVDLPIEGDARCQNAAPFAYGPNQLCAISTGSQGTCVGDSGGALYVGDSNVIAGINSAFHGVCGETSLFTRVSAIRPWLDACLAGECGHYEPALRCLPMALDCVNDGEEYCHLGHSDRNCGACNVRCEAGTACSLVDGVIACRPQTP